MALMGGHDLEYLLETDASEELRALLAKGMDPDGEIRHLEMSLLSLAAGRGSLRCAQALLEAGARAGRRDGQTGCSPLHHAAEGDGQIARLLLEAGADPNARDEFGQTPLHFAGSAESARLLLEAGASLKAENDVGQTPLMAMVNYWRWGERLIGVIEELVAAGADPAEKNGKREESALDSALRAGDPKAAEALERALAKRERRVLEDAAKKARGRAGPKGL